MSGITTRGTKLYLKSGVDFLPEDVIALLTKVSEVGATVDELDTTTLDSVGFKEFAPDLKDGGTVTINGNEVTGSTGYARIKALFDKDPTDPEVFGEFGISHPTVISLNQSFKAYVSKLVVNERGVGGLMGFTADLRISGAIVDFTDPVEPPAALNLETELALHQPDYTDTLAAPYNMTVEASGYTAGDDTMTVIMPGNLGANEVTNAYPSFPSSPSAVIAEADVITAGVIDQAKFQVELIKAFASMLDDQAFYVNNTATKDRVNTAITLESADTVVKVVCDNAGDTTFTLARNTATQFELSAYVQGI